jgi:hypothetical protein
MNKPIRLLILPFTLLASALIFTPACTKAQEAVVVSAIQPVGACIADIVLAATGVEDPLVIAANCSAAVADVYLVVSELLSASPPAPSDAGTPLAMTINMRSHLQRIQVRAFNLLMNDGGSADAGK